MHLRRLIVLIIYARNLNNPNRSCTVQISVIGPMYFRSITAPGLIGQIKKTRIHVAKLCLSEGVGSNGTASNLFTMSKYRVVEAKASTQPNFALISRRFFRPWGSVITGPLCSLDPKGLKEWWSQTGSNRRHPACKAGALPAELWPHLFRSSFVPRRTTEGRTPATVCRLSQDQVSS